MRGQEDIIRARFARELCGVCGATRSSEDVIILAHRSSRWMVLVTCWQCHHRGIFIATFPRDPRTPHTEPVGQADLQPHTAPLHPSLGAPHAAEAFPIISSLGEDATNGASITHTDVDEMRRFLASFNGDFHTLFSGDAG